MVAVRECESETCRSKLPPYWPRQRVDGKLLCDNCARGGKGSVSATRKYSSTYVGSLPEMEDGAWCSKCGKNSFERDQEDDRVVRCASCTTEHRKPSPTDQAFFSLHHTAVRKGDRVRLPDGGEGVVLTTDPKSENLGIWSDTKNTVSISMDDGGQVVANPDELTVLSLLKEAHDSGDGQTIYHCPFCGSGSVIGRSDGTVECEYCENCFTVQVQPSFPNMPQTNPVTGEPLPQPGMPGSIDSPVDGALADPESEPKVGFPVEEEQPTVGGPVAGEEEVPPNPEGPVGSDDMEKESSIKVYVTASGYGLKEEAFTRHLAIHYADDPEAVLQSIVTERAGN